MIVCFIEFLCFEVHLTNGRGNDFDDLNYVGVIQVDTKNVHCHLTMVDMGAGKIASDGNQKGKISQRAMSRFRRGVAKGLDMDSKVPRLDSQYRSERLDLVSHVRRRVYLDLEQNGLLQMIALELPDDSRLWRYRSNDKRVQKANQLTESYVMDLMSGSEELSQMYDSAVARIDSVSIAVAEENDYDEDSRLIWIQRKEDELTERLVNSVYAGLKVVGTKDVTTPMLEASVSDDATLDMIGAVGRFVKNVRKYDKRKTEHLNKKHLYRSRLAALPPEGQNKRADMFREFYKFEEYYHHALSDKYLNLVNVLPDYDSYKGYLDDLNKVLDEERGRVALLRDTDLKRLRPDVAESQGRIRYGVPGGRFLKNNSQVVQKELATLREKKRELIKAVADELEDNGIRLTIKEDGQYGVDLSTRYKFDDVKWLDLHDCVPNDYIGDWLDRYNGLAKRRLELFDKVKNFLTKTGQKSELIPFNVAEFERMRKFIDAPDLSKREPERFDDKWFERIKRSTVSLDVNSTVISENVQKALSEAIDDIETE